MEVKKKNFLENLRLKTKFPKKQQKKLLAKQGRNLAHRRSISVPDLTFVPGETYSTDSALMSAATDCIFFGNSPGLSDTDSVASSSITDGPLYTDEARLRVPQLDHSFSALNRVSAPILTLYEDIDKMTNLENNAVYAQVDKKAKSSAPQFAFEPVSALRNVYCNVEAFSPRPDQAERVSLSGEDTSIDRLPSGALAAVLARANSPGEQMSPYTEKKTISLEQKKPPSEKETPPTVSHIATTDRMSLTLDSHGTPMESADGTSLDSACGTPSEEQGNMPWTTDSEEPDPWPPLLMRELSIEEGLLDQEAQTEEAKEDIAEVSIIIHLTV